MKTALCALLGLAASAAVAQAPASAPGRGAQLFRACAGCHGADGGGTGAAPTLHGVVGRAVASVPAVRYSAAMKAFGGVWTPQRLDQFLAAPGKVIPGTSMTFGGVPAAADRAAVIEYLAHAK